MVECMSVGFGIGVGLALSGPERGILVNDPVFYVVCHRSYTQFLHG